MLVVGLTGGIATGKSTVAKLLQGLGARIIDLDTLSRKVVEPGSPALWEIKKKFGEGVINPDGTLNRKALGELVFGDQKARRELEAIVHPKVLEEMTGILRDIGDKDPEAMVFVDVPLLLELNLQGMFDEVVLVYAPREVQKIRLIKRDGLTEEEAEARLKAQMDIEEKLSKVKLVIENTGTVEETECQVRKLFFELKERVNPSKERLALDHCDKRGKLYLDDSLKGPERRKGKMTLVGKVAPDFELEGFHDGHFHKYRLSDYRGKWVFLLFYPLDFTFVCPTEVINFSEAMDQFRSLNCEVFGISVDSKYVHKAWVETKKEDGGLGGKLNFPLLSDINKTVASSYGILLEEEGVALRALFLVNPDGQVVHMTVNHLAVGRSVKEAMRVLKAFQFVTTHHGQVCPADWEEGREGMVADSEGLRRYLTMQR